nr:HYR domain-containing protein [uncultured Flavobacterium sp.]
MIKYTIPYHKKTIFRTITTFCLIILLCFTSYGQGCPEVPHTILNGTNGFSIEGKATNDHLGSTTKSAGDINGDGIADIMIGAPGVDAGGLTDVGAIYVIFGKAGLSTTTFDVSTLDGTNGFVIKGLTTGEKLGAMLSKAGDFNNDGVDDIIVGDNYNPSGQGTAFVFFGSKTTFLPSYDRTAINATNGVIITVDQNTNTSVSGVSDAGDFNKDGISDVVIITNINSNTNYVVLFGKTGISNTATSSINGTNGYQIECFSKSSSGYSSIVRNAGDINNDNIDDLILGFPSYMEGTEISVGRVVVVFGKSSGFSTTLKLDLLTATEGFIITNSGQYTAMGTSVAGAGDFNNDGIKDIIFGAPGKTANGFAYSGEVYILFGKNTFPLTFPASGITSGTGVVFQGKDNFVIGKVADGIKDINRDGISDIIFAAANGGVSYLGAVYVVFGGTTATGTVTEDKIYGTMGYQIYDDEDISTDYRFGQDASGIGDFNNDGTNDFIIGSIGHSDYYNKKGKAYVFYGEKLDRFDTQKPTITCPINQELYVNATLPNYVSYLESVSDNCTQSTDLIFTQTPPRGTLFTEDTNVKITVTDKSGNTESCTFLVKKRTQTTTIDCKTDRIQTSNLDGTIGFTIYGEKHSTKTGYSVNTVGDINADGIADFIVSATGEDFYFQGPNRTEYPQVRGGAFVVFGKTSGFPPNIDLGLLNGTNGFAIRNTNPAVIYVRTGYDVGSAGDINGDGIGDLMLSNPSVWDSNGNLGYVYIIYGKNTAFSPEFFVSTLDGTNGFTISGVKTKNEYFGYSIDAIGDFNKDGIGDIAIVSDGDATTHNGKCTIVYGASTFPSTLNTDQINGSNGFIIEGNASPNMIGPSVTGLGDINGDGIPDIAIGGKNSREYVVYGSVNPFPAIFNISSINGTNGFIVEDSANPLSGYSAVSKVGDINGDGYKDIAFSKGNIVFGGTSIPANLDLNTLNGTNGFRITNTNTIYSFGPAGDFNKDGFDDFIFTTNQIATVLYGKSTWSANSDYYTYKPNDALKIELRYTANYAGNFAGDVNKDGIDDIIIGSSQYYYSGYNINNDPGFAYVIFGKKKIADIEKPVITNCPANKILAIGDPLSNYKTAITVTDNCDSSPVVTQNPVAGTIFTGGSQTVTLTATDASSNFSTCSFTISSVADTQPPTITCPSDQLIACGSATIPNYVSLVTVSDNTDPSPTVTQSPIAGSAFVPGMTITMTAKDVSNNESTCSFKVNTATDAMKPVITCIGNQTLSCGGTIPDFTTLITVTDNCDLAPTITQSPVVGSPFVDGMTITMTAKDISNNSAVCSFKVNASLDIIKPVITCIGNQTLSCGTTIPDYTTLITVTDNCDASPIITQNPIPGSPFVNGMTVVITAKDASNNEETCNFFVNATDIIKPNITCPGNQVLAVGGLLPDYSGSVIVSDNCDPSPVITQNPVAGSTFTNGMTVLITAKDDSGNIENCSFIVTQIADTELPKITCLTDQNAACSTITIPDYRNLVTVTDNQDPNPQISQSPIPGSTFVTGMIVTITAKDASNNIQTCSFKVNPSADLIKPVITSCLTNQNVAYGSLLGDYRSKISASDNCDSNVSIIQNPIAGTTVADGMKVEIKVSDKSGNESVCSFIININKDTEAPVFTCIDDQIISCKTKIIPDYTKMVVVKDNEDSNPIITQNPVAGSAFVNGMAVEIKATDRSKNSTVCTFLLNSDILSIDAGEDQEIKKGQSVQLSAIATENGTFKWRPSVGMNSNLIFNPIVKPEQTTTYTVTFINEDGCDIEDSVTVSVISNEKDNTKYGISPNNDGINDFWSIDGIENFPENKVSIYNSWGDLVFQTKGYNNSTNFFTGKANKSTNLGANELPEGTYFFEINVDKPNHFKKLKGYLVLKR